MPHVEVYPENRLATAGGPAKSPSKLDCVVNTLDSIIDNFQRTSSMCQDIIDKAEGDSSPSAEDEEKAVGPGITGILKDQCLRLTKVHDQLRQRVEYLHTII